MKKSLQLIFTSSFFLLIGLVACNKETTYLADPVTSSDNTYIKFLHVAPNMATIAGQADNITISAYNFSNSIFAKLTGPALSYEKYFPTTTNAYVGIPAGLQRFKISLAAVAQKDSVELFLKTLQADAGKYYSFILTDSVKSATPAKVMFLQDDILSLNSYFVGLRFVHAIWNDTAGKTIDVFSTRNNGVIFSGRGAGSASAFTQFNYYSTSDTLIIRRAGTSFELARVNGFVSTPGRNYTILYKGNGDVTTSTAKPRSVLIYGH